LAREGAFTVEVVAYLATSARMFSPGLPWPPKFYIAPSRGAPFAMSQVQEVLTRHTYLCVIMVSTTLQTRLMVERVRVPHMMGTSLMGPRSREVMGKHDLQI
jgi:hypothetical protein